MNGSTEYCSTMGCCCWNKNAPSSFLVMQMMKSCHILQTIFFYSPVNRPPRNTQHFSNLNPTESQFTQFFQHLTRNVKSWSSRSFLFLFSWGWKQFSATVSGVTGLIAMWWSKDDNTCARASASESSSSLSLVPISRQSLIYYALVYPYLNYGCILWGNNYEAPVSQLVKLQNQVERVINNVPLRDHITLIM